MFKKRVFQDYTGSVPELRNISFSDFWILEENSEPIILWFKLSNSNTAFRIFVDDIYCGIDEYENEFYETDLDDDSLLAINYSHIISNRKLKDTFVTNDHEKKEIVLTLLFYDDLKVILKSNYEGTCEMKIV